MAKELIIPSNPADIKAIKSEVEECVHALTRAEAEHTFVSETVKALAEKFEIPTKYLNKLIRTSFKQNLDTVKEEADTLDEFYSAVYGRQTVD